MKNISLCLFVLSFVIEVSAQEGGYENLYHENGSNSAYCIKPTSDGGYIMTGFSNPTYSFYGQDIMLFKISGQGTFEWSMNYDASNSSDHGHAVIQSYDNQFALVGRASVPSSFDGDGCFILTDSDGNLIQQSFFGGAPEGDRLEDLIQLPSDSSFVLVGITGNHPYLVRTDKNGDTLFTKIYTEITGVFQAVTCSEDGQFLYLVGYSGIPSDGMIMKIDLLGNIIWENFYEIGADEYYDIVIQQNLLYVVGRTKEFDMNGHALCMIRWFDEFDGQMIDYTVFDRGAFRSVVPAWENSGFVMVGRNVFTVNSTLEGRIYVVKVDAGGEMIWEKEFGDPYPASNIGRGVCRGHDYGYMVCGQMVNNGVPYVYVIKIDENGSVLSSNSFPILPEISIYPNPCSEQLNIQLGSHEGDKQITIFNSAGQQVWQESTTAQELQINAVSQWQAGVYLVHIEVGVHKVVRKMVVE